MPPISALFSDTWRLYKHNFWRLVGILLVPTLFAFGSGLLLEVSLLISIMLFIVAAVFYMVSYLAVLYALANNQNISSAYQSGFHNFLPYLWISILTNLIFAGGLAMFFVPAFIFLIWFLFGVFIYVKEGRRGLEAILISKEYARGYFWPLVGRIFLIILIFTPVVIILGLVSVPFGEIGTEILSIIFQIVITSFGLVYSYSMYEHLRSLKPNLQGVPYTGKKGFFIFSAVLGIFAFIAFLILVALGSILTERSGLNFNERLLESLESLSTGNN